MKKIIYINFLLIALTLNSCAKRIYATPAVIGQIENSGNFTFMAEQANPTGMDVIKVLSIYPAGSQSVLNLDQGYVLTVKDKKLTVDLPYFGRLYTPNFDSSKNSFNFTTEDFTINKSQDKKGNWRYLIEAKNDSRTINFNLEIFRNGKAYLNANASDRQPISYDGFVKTPKPEKM